MADVGKSNRARAMELRQQYIDRLPEGQHVPESDGCSAAWGHAADAFLAGLAAFDAGAYEKAELAFGQGQAWIAAGEACEAANAALKQTLP